VPATWMVPDGPRELVSGCRRLGLGGTESPPPCFGAPSTRPCLLARTSHATARIDGCASWTHDIAVCQCQPGRQLITELSHGADEHRKTLE